MITALEAKKLYEAPPLTLEEIEQQIKEAAKGRNYTCFDVVRISQETRSALIEAGYSLQENGTDVIVNW